MADYLSQAKVRNQTLNQIDGYRIGWIVLFRNGDPKVILGKATPLRDSLRPGEVLDVPAQKITPMAEAKEVLFFIAEATWQSGGWKQDLKEIESIVAPQKSHPAPGAFNSGDSSGW